MLNKTAVAFAILVAAVLSAGPAMADPITVSVTTGTGSGADTLVNGGSGGLYTTRNYGGSSYVQVSAWFEFTGFLRFDLATATGAIPVNATVTDATLAIQLRYSDTSHSSWTANFTTNVDGMKHTSTAEGWLEGNGINDGTGNTVAGALTYANSLGATNWITNNVTQNIGTMNFPSASYAIGNTVQSTNLSSFVQGALADRTTGSSQDSLMTLILRYGTATSGSITANSRYILDAKDANDFRGTYEPIGTYPSFTPPTLSISFLVPTATGATAFTLPFQSAGVSLGSITDIGANTITGYRWSIDSGAFQSLTDLSLSWTEALAAGMAPGQSYDIAFQAQDTTGTWTNSGTTTLTMAVPEPATLGFLAIGGFGMIGAAIRRRRGT